MAGADAFGGQIAAGSNRPIGRLGPVNTRLGDPVYFHKSILDQGAVTNIGPLNLRRVKASTYVPVPVALSDHIPEEWRANNPAEISFECIVVGNNLNDVKGTLRKLEGFQRKGPGGEPPELVFVVGGDSWAVRLHRVEETPTLWDVNSVKEIRTKVSITLHTVRAWSS